MFNVSFTDISSHSYSKMSVHLGDCIQGGIRDRLQNAMVVHVLGDGWECRLRHYFGIVADIIEFINGMYVRKPYFIGMPDFDVELKRTSMVIAQLMDDVLKKYGVVSTRIGCCFVSDGAAVNRTVTTHSLFLKKALTVFCAAHNLSNATHGAFEFVPSICDLVQIIRNNIKFVNGYGLLRGALEKGLHCGKDVISSIYSGYPN